jgi:uncharacterized phage protein (TIGR01671 family)
MKREIKFRAWDKKKKKWVQLNDETRIGFYLSQEQDKIEVYILRLGFDYKNLVLMQYTGLKDKNGKEIYEGDVLANREVHGDSFYCLVEYQLDGFYGTTYPSRNHSMPLHTIMTYEGAEYNEIIGNIYENPNLIEDNK